MTRSVLNAGPPRSAHADSVTVIGIDLGGTKCHGVLAELDGSIIAEDTRRTVRGRVYETLLDCASTLRAKAAALGRPVAALVLGVPGVVEADSGRVFAGANVGWQGFDLGDRLVRDLAIPIAIENDADLAAIGEARCGAAQGVRDFILMSIGTGIGAAVVVDGRLVKGRHNAAGEIGTMVLDRAQLREPTGAGLGWFERVAAGPGVALRAADLLERRGTGRSEMEPSLLTAQDVFAAAREGDPVACATIDALLDDLAMGLIALVSTLDPEVVILDGGVGRALRPQLAELVRRVARHTPVAPSVTVSYLEPTAAVTGAVHAASEVVGRAMGGSFGTLARSMALSVPDAGRRCR